MTPEQLRGVGLSLIAVALLIVIIFLPAFIAYRRRTYYRGWINLLCLVPLVATAFGTPGYAVSLFGWFVLVYYACIDEKDTAAE